MLIKSSKKCKIVALIVAAGFGSRCTSEVPKQYMKLADKAVLFYAAKRLLINHYIDYIRVVVNKDHKDFYREVSSALVLEKGFNTKLLTPVYGGKSRQDSVRLGLESLQKIDPDFIIIHDACRPFVSDTLINSLVRSMISDHRKYAGVVPVIKVENTISLISDDLIESTIQRQKLRAVQTPQIFNYKELLSCHRLSKKFTDDSSIVVECKKHVLTIKGEKSNFKLTTIEDINLAKLLLREPKYRIGTGYDIHRFINILDEKNENLIKICGVEIKHDMAIKGNSDGDVAIHAIVDAILGALGCGDIGEYFQSNSLEWRGYNSSNFLVFAIKKAKEKGYYVSNLDITIVCEKPKISPYKVEMRKSVSRLLGINAEFVNVKATTAEELDSIGRNKGIAAYASVLLSSDFSLVKYD